jgi:hypothetical protein
MSIATGRDSQAYNLLSTPLSLVRIAIPSICCMEALSALEDELKRRNRFENELNLQISQLRRDVTSPYAQSLLFHVRQSVVENRGLLNDVKERLFQALAQLAAKAEMIALTLEVQQPLRNAGVEPYFRTTESFLGWLNSQSTS